jgi:CrcB protein
VGGQLIGAAVACVARHPEAPAAWRLFIIAGFRSGVTTFSTFSVEVAHDLTDGHVGWALGTAVAHLLGSVSMTLLGMTTVALARKTAG